MMQDEPKSSNGPISSLLQSLTQLVATLVTMAQTRLELLTTELQEEIQRAASMLLWAFVALFTAGMGLFMLALVIIFACWDTHRILASVLVTLVFFGIAAFAVMYLRKQINSRPRMLDATLSELARDRQRLDERMRRPL